MISQPTAVATIETVGPDGSRVTRPETRAETEEREFWERKQRQLNHLTSRHDGYIASKLRSKHFNGGPINLREVARLIGRERDLSAAFEIASSELPSELSLCGDLDARHGLAQGTIAALLR
jgi:hypothetical protein